MAGRNSPEMRVRTASEQARPLDWPVLRRAMLVGTVLQLVLALLAHLSGWIAVHALLFGAMMLSAISGYLYALDTGRGFADGATGGVIVGGACGLFGVATSVVIGDTDPGLFVQNSIIFAFTGGIGGLFGHMAAVMQPPRGREERGP